MEKTNKGGKMKKNLKSFYKSKSAVFGLTSVQTFFAIILAVALLAYVIVIIMGTLSGTTILASSTATAVNESGYINTTGYTLAQSTLSGFAGPAIVTIINATDNKTIGAGNYTLTGNVLTNATATAWPTVKVTYTYSYYNTYQNDLNAVLSNTSTGITGFFSGINPVYGILAVLVIILVLVVLVRVVTGSTGSGAKTPAL